MVMDWVRVNPRARDMLGVIVRLASNIKLHISNSHISSRFSIPTIDSHPRPHMNWIPGLQPLQTGPDSRRGGIEQMVLENYVYTPLHTS